MHEFTTPMMKQYMDIKKQYQDCLLFFRMGDFYELFLEDALTGAKVLNITLTSRPKGKDGRIPMAGVPFHAVDSYLAKLVKAGYKVAICEQITLPNKYGIIDREVIRVVTPGTMLDEKALEKKENNYIISLLVEKKKVSIAAADISTGFFSVFEIEFENLNQILQDEMSRLKPVECILPQALYDNPEILGILKTNPYINIYCFHEWLTFATDAKEFLKKHFGIKTLATFGLEKKKLAQETAAALLGYLKHTQKSTVSHIKKIIPYVHDEYMQLDRSTMINLELFSTIREHDTRGTLISILDHTITAMGGRLLKSWISKPLISKPEIHERHVAVDEYVSDAQKRVMLQEELKRIPDIERITSRLSVGMGNARDLINLKHALETILNIKRLALGSKSKLMVQVARKISPQTHEIITLIQKNIKDEPPIELREGGLIKEGVSKELDMLRATAGKSKDWVLKLEAEERKKSGIGSLKVRFNKVFGFYIEISKANLHLVPKNYMRKQTLVNGERYITPELKHHEEIILSAEEKIKTLEYSLFQEILEKILTHIQILQEAARGVAIVDCILNFSSLAEKENYCKPEMVVTGAIVIKSGRHPVVEKLLEHAQFVANDVFFDSEKERMMLITGPNMAGKSVYIRQVALIVLMAQIGCFVPAQEASISIVDRIFVRSGASDAIVSGLSTFMVEMVETAHILHNATDNSLIIMDEIGRGTSTYDGISIAWAIAEYLVTYFKTPPKTLFATHYHELQVLEKDFPEDIKNFHLMIQEHEGKPTFLYVVNSGAASHSFGVAVAELAGIPDAVIVRARKMLHELEARKLDESSTEKNIIQAMPGIVDKIIYQELEHLDIHQMTPLDALNTLAQLKEKLKLITHTKDLSIDID